MKKNPRRGESTELPLRDPEKIGETRFLSQKRGYRKNSFYKTHMHFFPRAMYKKPNMTYLQRWALRRKGEIAAQQPFRGVFTDSASFLLVFSSFNLRTTLCEAVWLGNSETAVLRNFSRCGPAQRVEKAHRSQGTVIPIIRSLRFRNWSTGVYIFFLCTDLLFRTFERQTILKGVVSLILGKKDRCSS